MTTLICLPYAGAGAGIYRPWQRLSSPALQAVPVQVPGREEEFGRPFYRNMTEAAAGTAERIRAVVGGDPFIVFGHSFGAFLAYESVRCLANTGGPLPLHLAVSGSTSPCKNRTERLDGTDEEDAAWAEWINGEPVEAFIDPGLRSLLLPILRADMNLLADHRPGDCDPLPLPITALRGDADQLVPPDAWLDWSRYTSTDFRAIEFAGGHMYVQHSWTELWKTLEDLAPHDRQGMDK
ncbi:alpha/beta fold hydrolase [Streptomyces sp. NPDC046994]|uniref:thioesterase II family protein n=1 Tax=Streptomyces sp. NPDC046994 TaxID=3155735 RepID=UPI003451760D